MVFGCALGAVQRPAVKVPASNAIAKDIDKSFDIKASSVDERKSPAIGANGGASYLEERGLFSRGTKFQKPSKHSRLQLVVNHREVRTGAEAGRRSIARP